MEGKEPVRVLVTGGLGYIGSLLVKDLLEHGDEVVVIDRHMFPYAKKHSGATYKDADLTKDFGAFQDAVSNADRVIHLAAIVGEAACLANPESAFETNYLLTKKISEECSVKKKRLVYASTCSLYGNQHGLLNEQSKTMPVDFYGQTKLLGEREVLKVPHSVSLRLGTVYGWSYRNRFDLVINKFVAQTVAGEPMRVFGGEQNRPFTNVKDIARGFEWAAKSNAEGIFNLAHQNFSLNEAATTIARLLKGKVEIVQTLEDNRNYTVSSEKIAKAGYSFSCEFNEEIVRMAELIGKEKIDYREARYHNHLWVK